MHIKKGWSVNVQYGIMDPTIVYNYIAPTEKIKKKKKRAGVGRLPGICEVLSSIPSTAKIQLNKAKMLYVKHSVSLSILTLHPSPFLICSLCDLVILHRQVVIESV